MHYGRERSRKNSKKKGLGHDFRVSLPGAIAVSKNLG